MRLRNRMIGVIRELRTANNMTPLHANLISSLHINDLCRHRRPVPKVTRHVLVVDILNRVVGVGDTDSIQLSFILAIHTHALSNAVRRCEEREQRKGGNGGELHGGGQDFGDEVEEKLRIRTQLLPLYSFATLPRARNLGKGI